MASTPFNGECEFIAAAASLDRIPPEGLSEIAFAGRSNVGKSSLINALTGRKALARTSHTPGRTQQLNFFNIKDSFVLVDMPGYGYAKVSKTTRQSWDKLIKHYLRGRVNLKCTFILVDSRHGLKDSDREMMKMLDETAVAYRIILTKSDKITAPQKERVIKDVQEALKKYPAAFPEPLLCSSHKSEGLSDIQDVIMGLI